MDYKQCGDILAEARKKKGYTQKEVAIRLNVSDKAVSKWERGAGCPDIRILSDLADILEIDSKVLLSGIASCNTADNGNLKRLKLYVCPDCHNIITSTGNAELACCGKQLKELKVKKEDSQHMLLCERSDDGYFVRMEQHPMNKEHYISFICYVTGDKFFMVKLYPEQNCEVHLRIYGHGYIYAYCNEDGLYGKVI